MVVTFGVSTWGLAMIVSTGQSCYVYYYCREVLCLNLGRFNSYLAMSGLPFPLYVEGAGQVLHRARKSETNTPFTSQHHHFENLLLANDFS